MRKTLEEKMIRHFLSVAPKEGVGFLVRSGKTGRGEQFVAVENKIDDELSKKLLDRSLNEQPGFLIDPLDYCKHSRKIKAIVHSHFYEVEPENYEPSAADLRFQKATGVPWIIFAFVKGEFKKHFTFGGDVA